MEEILLNHPAWRHASEGKLAKARDGIEKYVMDKVSDIAFNQLKECQQWMKEDEALLRRMQLLSVRKQALDEGMNSAGSCRGTDYPLIFVVHHTRDVGHQALHAQRSCLVDG